MTQTEEAQKEVVETATSEEDIVNEKLMAQIEYYFGDVNLPRDKFIKDECSKNEGWFSVPSLLKFNRVANILRNIPKDNRVKRICEALKPSALVDVNETDFKIRRNLDCPLPEKDSEERTVYLKGFNRTETALDDLLEYFKKYEGVESVIMRYYKEKTIKTEEEIKKAQDEKEGNAAENGSDKAESENKEPKSAEPQLVWVRKFKGSVFVVFKTIEQAKKVLEEPDLVFKGTPIPIKMWQTEYKAQKAKEYQQKLANRKKKAGSEKKSGENEEKEEGAKEEVPKGVLVKVLNVPEGYTREIIKEKWFAVLDKEKFAIAFIDFNKGDKNGVLRLEKEGSAKEALELIVDKKLKMKDEAEGVEAIYSELQGFEEEEEGKYVEEIKRQRENIKNRKRAGGFGGGRGRGGKRKRRY